MRNKRKINWNGTLFLIITIVTLVLAILELENLTSCFTTYSYQVWICNTSLRFFIFIISFIIWSLWFLYHLIDLCCLEWKY